MSNKKKLVLFLCISIALVVFGSLGVYLVHTDGLKVKITDITYVTEDGARMSALLYIPDSATVENPVPAVVSMHGYNNTREVQDLNAVELSRRGYIVMAIDAYDHGGSSFPDPRIRKGVVLDMGTYSALQYLGTIPFVDKNNIGMVGHSLGGICLQFGANRAFKMHDKDPSIIVPKALVPTEHAFLVGKNGSLVYGKYLVHVGLMFGRYDEWAENMWGVPTADKVNISKKGIGGMGFSGAEYDSYYIYKDNNKLSREEAIAAVKAGKKLRVIYQPETEHPEVHFDTGAVSRILDFFDITLKGGMEPIAAAEQVWPWKQFFNGLVLVGFFLFIVPFAFLMLEIPYFKSIVKPEPVAPSVANTAKTKLIYWAIFIICLLPAPLIFNWAIGYPIGIKSFDRYVPTVFPLNSYFQLPCVNGIVLLMLIVAPVLLIIFILTYYLIMKGNGVAFKDLGVKLSGRDIGKSVLLALIVFIATYMLLVVSHFFFQSDARFWVFSAKLLTPIKFFILLKYVPFFLLFYMINMLLLNSFTRIRGAGEATNIVLMVLANVAGLAVLTILDYVWLFKTGQKMFPYVPFPPNTTSALAGILLWNLLFILPVAAVIGRLFFRKTGTIWLGGFVNTLIITFFSISNTVLSAGMI